MPTVAIVHAADDALPARALAEKLRAAKLTVVLERPPGEETRAAGKNANVTIALWSPRSVAQVALADDVAFLRGKTKLIHASMQNASPPDAFRGDKTVNLTGWRGEDEFPGWRELAKQVTDKAGVAPLPPPAPRPASGFFQPGLVNAEAQTARPPQQQRAQQRPAAQQAPRQQAQRPAPAPQRSSAPPQRAPQQSASEGSGGGRGFLIGAIVFVVVALAGGGGYWFWSQQQGAQTTSAAWDAIDRNDADSLRAFISGDPGERREEAQQALAELEERSFEAASDADTIEAFEAFVNDFPESQHALAARGRIAELQTMTPAAATDSTTLAPTETTPDPDLVPPGATTPDTSGGPATLTPPAEEQPAETPPAGPTN